MKPISKEWLLSKKRTHKCLPKAPLKAKLYLNLRNSNLNNKKSSLTNLPMKRSRDKLKSSKTKPSRRKLLWLKRKERMKKFFPRPELKNLRNSKRKKLSKNLKPREWNKNSCQLRPSKKLKLLLQRKLLLKLTWPD